ncbi:hypothetical protein DPM13_00520 [Paracoccus mutanolyticus]|uniref:Uncharacterized protein n=1 Tax=Paracoccus mutanolyticus TaxID=1499308 RepID=A0ABM6WNW4_9RHOB|nr:hypothetical protein DPM13_00520 [Paracoccus mutanolyticus]
MQLNRILFDFAAGAVARLRSAPSLAPSDWTPFLTKIFLHAGWLLSWTQMRDRFFGTAVAGSTQLTPFATFQQLFEFTGNGRMPSPLTADPDRAAVGASARSRGCGLAQPGSGRTPLGRG